MRTGAFSMIFKIFIKVFDMFMDDFIVLASQNKVVESFINRCQSIYSFIYMATYFIEQFAQIECSTTITLEKIRKGIQQVASKNNIPSRTYNLW